MSSFSILWREHVIDKIMTMPEENLKFLKEEFLMYHVGKDKDEKMLIRKILGYEKYVEGLCNSQIDVKPWCWDIGGLADIKFGNIVEITSTIYDVAEEKYQTQWSNIEKYKTKINELMPGNNFIICKLSILSQNEDYVYYIHNSYLQSNRVENSEKKGLKYGNPEDNTESNCYTKFFARKVKNGTEGKTVYDIVTNYGPENMSDIGQRQSFETIDVVKTKSQEIRSFNSADELTNLFQNLGFIDADEVSNKYVNQPYIKSKKLYSDKIIVMPESLYEKLSELIRERQKLPVAATKEETDLLSKIPEEAKERATAEEAAKELKKAKDKKDQAAQKLKKAKDKKDQAAQGLKEAKERATAEEQQTAAEVAAQAVAEAAQAVAEAAAQVEEEFANVQEHGIKLHHMIFSKFLCTYEQLINTLATFNAEPQSEFYLTPDNNVVIDNDQNGNTTIIGKPSIMSGGSLATKNVRPRKSHKRNTITQLLKQSVKGLNVGRVKQLGKKSTKQIKRSVTTRYLG